MTKQIKILCLDQATKITGYSIWEDNKLITYGTLEVDSKEKNIIERMKLMSDKIIELIENNNPGFIVFEDCQFQRNYGTFQQLSQLQGILMKILFDQDIGFKIIQPSAWKSVAGVKGRKRTEQKSSAIKIVQNKYNIKVTEDEADAILMGVWAISKMVVNA